MITIIDSGGANISSIQFSLERLGMTAQLSHDANVIKQATHVILPGVATASYAMGRLREYGLIDVIKSLTQPVLGICLGMQLLFDYSEEGDVPCLGIISGTVKKIKPQVNDKLIVPHMGWNKIKLLKKIALFNNVPNDSYVYFVHSYAAPLVNESSTSTHYESIFSSSVHYNNFFGTQFHPERSSHIGTQILKNFLEI